MADQPKFRAPEPLSAEHDISEFNCGEQRMNEWFTKHALRNQNNGASNTFVVCLQDRVVAFYCLVCTAIAHDEVSKAMQRNMPDPIPCVLMGRLAVDQEHQKKGLSRLLLKDAFKRAVIASESVGFYALIVDAKNDSLLPFYEKLGFKSLSSSPQNLKLYMPLKRIKAYINSE